MKYRVLALVGMLALTAGAVIQAQDYDDIYYDASKAASTKAKVEKQTKTVAVYTEIPEKYKVAASDNYRVERDVDEYNRRGAYEMTDEPAFEIDLNGDTIYFNNDSIFSGDEAFANTRRIERFYNPDVVILSDDDDLVELYYDESPTINLIVGSDAGFSAYYGYDAFNPWYTGWYDPWYVDFYSPWYIDWYHFHSPWRWSYYWRWHGPSLWGWTYYGIRPMYTYGYYGWDNWWHNWDFGYKPHVGRVTHYNHNAAWNDNKGRVGLAGNRNGRDRVSAQSTSRNGIAPKGTTGSRSTSVGTTGSRVRGGYATSRVGGMAGPRTSSGSTVRSSSSGSRTSSGTAVRSSSAGSRTSGGSAVRSSSSGPRQSYGGSSGSRGGSYGGGSYGGGSGRSGGGGGSSSGGNRRR